MNQNPQTKHLKVYAPNVHLFAFHLAKEEDDKLLWRKCQEIFTKFNIESTLNIESRKGYRIDLLKTTNPQDILLPLESEITLDNVQEQLQADLGYFKHGTELLEQALNAIRVRVEIDQADRDRIQQQNQEKSDRQLQIALTAIGAGIAVAGIVAGSSGQVTADNPIYFPWQPKASDRLHPFTWFVIISIVCGLIAFVLMTLIVKFLYWLNILDFGQKKSD